MKYLLIIPATLFVLALSHVDQTTQESRWLSEMIDTCERSYQVSDGPLEFACGKMIDQVEATGKYRVVQHAGQFRVEEL